MLLLVLLQVITPVISMAEGEIKPMYATQIEVTRKVTYTEKNYTDTPRTIMAQELK